ncbi:MAG: T9SS type A sorting domain-containing protein [Chitinophagaceae bacterium]|nr:MAG: T9SS type A sorting domain-containing protein [Chitinophagaceae bacterium]
MAKNLATLLLIVTTAFSVNSLAQCGPDPGPATTLVVNTPNNIPNSFYPGASSPATGSTSVTIGALDNRGNATAIAAGDLIIIMQMQGADINNTNSDSYGDGVAGAPASGQLGTNLVAGVWEYGTVTAVSGSTLTLFSGLVNNYFTRAFSPTTGIQSFQVIRVPRYYSINIQATNSVTCPPWNGSTGGVVALDASNVITINGSVLANGKGFRGGGGFSMTGAGTGNSSSTSGTTPLLNTDFRFVSPVTNTANLTGGAKGEGIAGTPPYTLTTGNVLITSTSVEGYVAGAMGRSAPGNAGGGATDGQPVGANTNGYNTGGGGGSNYGAGGRGGSGWHSNAGNVNTYPYGGFGGTAFTGTIRSLIMGGGGGAGSANNSNTAQQYLSSGASGGGIILLRAASYAGTTGVINADGADALTITGSGNTDAAGGGGAGGTIVAITRTNTTVGLGGVTASARGGKGGNMENYFDHGPGGGGGGGLIITNGTFSGTPLVTEGANGLTRSTSTGGPINNAYGATAGSPGFLRTLVYAPGIQNASGNNSSCGVLPVNITSFSATLDGQAVQLSWQTAQVLNFSRFEVEWSSNGSNWQSLGIVLYDENKNSYQYLHSPVSTAINYYRLKLIDTDNSFLYSQVVFVRLRETAGGLSIYPQPAHAQFQVNMTVTRAQRSVFTIYNASGTQVHQVNVQLSRGNNGFVIDGLAWLTPGVYVLRASVDGKEETRKLLIN